MGIVTIPESENIMLLSCREKAELLNSYFPFLLVPFLLATKINDTDSAESRTHIINYAREAGENSMILQLLP